MKQAVRRMLTAKFFLIPTAALCLYSLIGFFLTPWVIGWYAPGFVKELETVGGIPSERLALRNPESQTSGPPSAGFSLDVQATSQ